LQITAIHHISLLVASTERALTFYHGLLCLPLAERPELSFPGAWLTIGSQQLHLLELPNPDSTTGRPEHAGRDRHLALSVSGLDELTARLEERGIAYTRSRSGRSAVFCRDPDGNGVELISAD
jgi:glyoxylase I family protein